jgi:hypothetical protein
VRKCMQAIGIAVVLVTQGTLCYARSGHVTHANCVTPQAGPRSSIAAAAFDAQAARDLKKSGCPKGHYEWRREIGRGPRAPLIDTRRVWVPDT